MAHIRGSRGKRPCPVCLAPLEQLSDVSKTWLLRTTEQTQQVIDEAKELSKTDCEKKLSAYGIRDVDVSLS
jgi:hypothetical protein